uniref:SCP domain-containing protein n=1 Tax=Plectus sambesii TaxID=2011161 RepID=A0A914W6L7_9BILA
MASTTTTLATTTTTLATTTTTMATTTTTLATTTATLATTTTTLPTTTTTMATTSTTLASTTTTMASTSTTLATTTTILATTSTTLATTTTTLATTSTTLATTTTTLATTTTTMATTTTTLATTTTAITTTSTSITTTTTTTACPVQSTAADEQAMVNKINQLRSGLAQGLELDKNNHAMDPSDNMLRMTWDSSLAADSQAWACLCTNAHSTFASRNAGENLYAQYGLPTDIQSNFVAAAAAWWKELKDNWTYLPNNYFYNNSTGVVGHYTQLAWAKTFQVGCGYAQCPNTIISGQVGSAVYIVCRFRAPGNYVPAEIYHPSLVPCTAGATCATTPGTTCGADGLCA